MATKRNTKSLTNKQLNRISDNGDQLFPLTDSKPQKEQLFTHFSVNKNHFSQETDLYQTGYFKIFMTKPDLNLTNKFSQTLMDTGAGETSGPNTHLTGQKMLKMEQIPEKDFILDCLEVQAQSEGTVHTGPFIKILSNMSRNAPMTDTTLKVHELYETFSGYKLPSGKGTKESRNAQQFSIQYHDTDDLVIMNMHRIWMEYIDKCKKGLIVRSQQNMQENIIDYMTQLYVFQLKPDGETINYWAKYTGIFPTGIPWTSLSMEQGQFQIPTFDIQYTYMYRAEMEDSIITQFNSLQGFEVGMGYGSSGSNLDNFAETNDFSKENIRDAIYPHRQNVIIEPVKVDQSTNKYVYKLRFADLG